ncbi:MAG: CpsD/CapB family tyrosine-protein kinase [Firmicutes bacterium]|nr:CpsD/CapB family tyrosine-protein kinase [Bacillota bacterium]
MIKKHRQKRNNDESKLITSKNPKSPVSEAFRTIRTNIEFSGIDAKIKTILVTSSQPGEGKSTVTANLAVSMATGGKRVLLIDADLRNPTQQRFFPIAPTLGLTNLLLDETLTLEEVIINPEDNLFLLTSGPTPPNPAELLGSAKMRTFITSMSEVFDIILVDSPPVLAVADASILANYLDGTILITGAGDVPRERTLAAKEQLTKVKANIIGTILNKAPMNEGYYYQYYYGSR